ncbi:MAG: hypothetical protein M3P29_01565 [Acidobacteriota bacterium]|nr:hypothetical protein [Acidobacteriota bacterium]
MARRDGIPIFLFAVALNFPWEMAQGTLYRMPAGQAPSWVHCLTASVWDGVLALLIVLSATLPRLRERIARPSAGTFLRMVLGGLVLAVAIEWIATRWLGRWSYTEAMPLIPILNVGVVPVLQLMLLPLLDVAIVSAVVRHRKKGI